MMMTRERRDQQQLLSRVFNNLSSLVMILLRSHPMSISSSYDHQITDSPTRISYPPMTPSGFASMLLGISVTLMISGSVTFFIGFVLMPWVMALFMLLYVAGLVSAISMLGRSLLFYVFTPISSSSRKDISSEWKLL